MAHENPGIVIVKSRIGEAQLARLVRLYFEDMVKYVVDVERAVAAAGSEMNSDAEEVLLEGGSR
jgi:hypothetical protein